MAMTITAFREAAATSLSTFRLDQHGDQTGLTRGTGLFGRAAAWLHGLTHKDENRAVMQSFVDSIRQSHGASAAVMAEKALDIPGGKPLTSRKIADVLQQADSNKRLVGSMNKMLALRFSQMDIHGDMNNFGKVLADAAHEKGMSPDLDAASTQALGDAISKAVVAAGKDGTRTVSIDEAKGIARALTDKFLAGSKFAQESLTPSTIVSEKEKREMTAAAQKGDVPAQVRVLQERFGEMHDPADPNCFGSMLADSAKRSGVPMDGLNVDRLSSEVSKEIRWLTQANAKLVSPEAAKALAQQKIDEFIAGKKTMLEAADRMTGLSEPEKAELKRIALDCKSSDPSYLTGVARLMTTAKESLCGQAGASADKVMAGIRHYYEGQEAVARELWADQSSKIDSDDLMSLAGYATRMAAVSSGMSRDDLGAVHDRLSSPDATELFRGLQTLASDGKTTAPGQAQAAGRMFNYGMTMLQEMGRLLGRQPGPEAAMYDSPFQIPDGALKAMRANGIDAPLPTGLGDEGSGPVNERFQEAFVKNVAEMLAGPESLDMGVGSAMGRDFNRASFVLGGETLCTSSHHAPKEQIADKFRRFFTGSDGQVDEKALLAVSKLAHQGAYAGIATGFMNGLGPFRSLPLMGNPDQVYDIQKKDNGDITISCSFISHPEQMISPQDGSLQFLDGETSFMSGSFEFTLRKEDIDRGASQAILTRPLTMSYSMQPGRPPLE